ncbi:MAG: response regulator [Acidobacteria bacterium]|nr:response regulator [Acidobacteriota bacterium]
MKPRILLVEDNELNLDALSRLLERRGYTVLPAKTGAQGVQLAVEALPDLVLMDLGLPDFSGLEATRRIKADPGCQGLPVLALTAHALTSDRENAFAAGCDDFDTKPVEMNRLCAKIEALLARRGPGCGVEDPDPPGRGPRG